MEKILSSAVFISRPAPAGSVFRTRMEAAGWQVEARSLLEMGALAFGALPETDWLFFSSSNAVRFFLQQVRSSAIPLPSDVFWAAIGPATAQTLEEAGFPVHFCGTGDPEDTAAAFVKAHSGVRVLFAGAREPRRLLRERIAAACIVQELPVYDNRPAQQIAVSHAAVLVFTSPMNAQAYFSTHALLPGQQVVAIGRSTRSALHALGLRQVTLAATPDEAALAAAVLESQVF